LHHNARLHRGYARADGGSEMKKCTARNCELPARFDAVAPDSEGRNLFLGYFCEPHMLAMLDLVTEPLIWVGIIDR